MGFNEAKIKLLEALDSGSFQHASRNEIDQKNLLHTGVVTKEDVKNIVVKCNGTHHERSFHHSISSLTVHVLKRDGWYIKFYFIDPDVFFLSVHK